MAQVRPYGETNADVRYALGLLEVLTGDAVGAVETLAPVADRGGAAKLGLSLAVTALGHEDAGRALRAAGIAELHADETTCFEDMLREEAMQFSLPSLPRRHWGEHMLALARGKFEESARICLAAGDLLPPHAPGAKVVRLRSGRMLPRWDGAHVRRLAVLFADGFGDAFMFARYLEPLRAKADELVAVVSTPIVPLAVQCLRDIAVCSLSDCSRELEQADAYITEWPLPGMSGAGYSDAMWVTPAPDLIERWRPEGPGPHVGVVWNGCLVNMHDNLRSIPVELLAPLFDVPGITWHSLQYGPKAAECPAGVIDHSPRLKNFADTAALIAGLDLVIAVDTAVANLTGAMGYPVAALVESTNQNDFRWGVSGERSPWYPSARVFRQERPGEWGPVIERVLALILFTWCSRN